jgi:hypothetical protein
MQEKPILLDPSDRANSSKFGILYFGIIIVSE